MSYSDVYMNYLGSSLLWKTMIQTAKHVEG